MPSRRAWLSLAASLLVSPLLAHATPLPANTPAVYTITVTGSGTLNGVSFTNQVVTFTTSTTLGAVTTISNGNVDHVTHTPTTVSVAGVGSDTLTDAISFVVGRNGGGDAGISDATEGLSIVVLVGNVFQSVSMLNNAGPISANALGVGGFTDSTPTSNGGNGGILFLSSESTGTYTAQIGSPVPEPSSLLMLVTGIAGVAGAVRKRLA